MEPFFALLVVSLAVGAVSLTLTKSMLFEFARIAVYRLGSKWLAKLVSCPYCVSHWIALVFVLLTETRFDVVQSGPLVGAIVTWLAIIGGSAIVVHATGMGGSP